MSFGLKMFQQNIFVIDLPILPYYNDWIHANYDETKTLLPQILRDLPDIGAEGVENVWRLIFSLTFHGKTAEAARLLPYLITAQNSSSRQVVLEQQISLMAELMNEKPQFNPSKDTVIEFEGKWYTWRDKCLVQLEQRSFFGNKKFLFLCKVRIVN